MSAERVRVLVADDHDLFREGLRQLLETVPTVTIIGEAADGQEAIQRVAELHPDVVLMDINMPRMDGIRATEYIVKHFPDTNVVVLTMYQDDEYAIHAIRAGAKSYLLKNSRSDEVIRAISMPCGERPDSTVPCMGLPPPARSGRSQCCSKVSRHAPGRCCTG